MPSPQQDDPFSSFSHREKVAAERGRMRGYEVGGGIAQRRTRSPVAFGDTSPDGRGEGAWLGRLAIVA